MVRFFGAFKIWVFKKLCRGFLGKNLIFLTIAKGGEFAVEFIFDGIFPENFFSAVILRFPRQKVRKV